MMPQACDDGFVKVVGRAVCLRVKCGGRGVLHPKERTQPLEKFAQKLQAVVSK